MARDMASEIPGGTRRFILPALFVVALFVALWMRRPDGETVRPWKLGGQAFGTSYSVVVVPDPKGLSQSDLDVKLTEVITFVNDSMSTYQADSELSQFNSSTKTDSQPISTALMQVLEAAKDLYQLSGGAFDVTVGPVVNAWGFGPEVVEPPSTEALEDARAKIGSDKLTLSPATGEATKQHAGLYIDLSAIAKGYAVDLLAAAIVQSGHHRFIVEIGGEVRAQGRNAKAALWSVGIEAPKDTRRGVAERIVLEEQSAATSGNYRNYKMVDGEVVTHIIDPRTGEPVGHGLGSVTVVHKDCMMADAWATALYVLGETAGLKVANEQGIAALFLTPEDEQDALRRTTTAAYDVLTNQTTPP